MGARNERLLQFHSRPFGENTAAATQCVRVISSFPLQTEQRRLHIFPKSADPRIRLFRLEPSGRLVDGSLAIGGNTIQFSPVRLEERRTTLLAESVRFSALTKRLSVVVDYPESGVYRFLRLETFGGQLHVFAFLSEDESKLPEIEKFYEQLRRFIARVKPWADERLLTETSGSESFDFEEYGLPASAGAVMSAVRAGKDKNTICERRTVVYRARRGGSCAGAKSGGNSENGVENCKNAEKGGKLRGLAQINHLKTLAERQQRRLVNPRKFGDCGAFAADPGHTDEFCRFGSLEGQGLDQMKWKLVFGLAKPFRPMTLSVEWPGLAVLRGNQMQFLGRKSAILSPGEFEDLVKAALPARLLVARAYVQFQASTDGMLMDTLVESFRGGVIRQALGKDARAKYNADIDFGALVLSRAVLFVVRLRDQANPAQAGDTAQIEKANETTLCVAFDMDGLSRG